MKVTNKKNSKLTKKQYLLILGALVGGLTVASPFAGINAFAEETVADNAQDGDVLFEDEEDDYTVDPIDNNDEVQDNTVVDHEEEQQQEQQEQQEQQKEEPKEEEPKQEEQKQNDGGDCVTPDHGYDEQAGEYWDPNIKTEPEKKNLTPEEETPDKPAPYKPEPDKPEPDKPEPDKPQPDKPEPDKPEPDKPTQDQTPQPQPQPQPQPTPAPAPVQTPKTGDFTWKEIAALLAGFGLIGGGITYGVLTKGENKEEEKVRTR